MGDVLDEVRAERARQDEVEPGRLMVYEPRVDGGWRHGWFLGGFRTQPTPADLLGDPRVRALVEAVELLRDWPDQYPRHHSALMKALAPFEVDRG